MASRMDIGGIIQNVFHLFKAKLINACSGPCDGPVLRMHYRWAFYYTIGGFMTVWYGWYFGKVIHCVADFRGDTEARQDYTQICLSYPYVEDEKKEKRFLLFYRWIHWSFLLLAFLFYLPRKISKSIENYKAKKILEDLQSLSPRYDEAEREMVKRAFHYTLTNLRTHNDLYFKYISLHILALFIDVSVLRFLDFIFHNRYLWLIPNSYPFNRDPIMFTDYISQTFPPFASCHLNDAHKILAGRTEPIGCHLTHMELYEKLFFIFWFFLIFLIVVTSGYLLRLLSMVIPAVQKNVLWTSKPWNAPHSVDSILSGLLPTLKVGDVYMLYKLKHHMHHSRFYGLLVALKESTCSIKEKSSDYIENNKKEKANQPLIAKYMNHSNNPAHVEIKNARNRFPDNQPYNPTSCDGFNKLTKEHYGSQDERSIYPSITTNEPSKLYKNTSILIE